MVGRASCAFLVLLGGLAITGCQHHRQVRDPEFSGLNDLYLQAHYAADPSFEAVAPDRPDLAGSHPVEFYVELALSQNPEIQAARKQVEALALQVPVAASLPDPMLNITTQPEPVQTAAGQQELVLAASQKLHWFGKLDQRAALAEAKANVSRAQLLGAEYDTVARVKRAYYELYFLQRAIEVTEAEQKLLTEIRDVADARYRSGSTSQQDVLRANLEISNTANELIQLRQRLESAQARLARLVHIAPQTAVLATKDLEAEDIPLQLDRLQQWAVANHPELQAQLAALQRDRRAVELARLDYKPDVTLGVAWIDTASAGISPVANGQDSFQLSAGLNLPIYQKRLDAAVRSAEAQAVSTARQFDAMRDMTLEQVTDLFSQIRSQKDLLVLFREDILPNARQTLDVSSRAYQFGEVDFLQLIDNWRQLLRYEINYYRLEASLRQSMAELEQQVGGTRVFATTPPNVDDAETILMGVPDAERTSARRTAGPSIDSNATSDRFSWGAYQ